MEPPSRNSMWRFGYPNPVDYNDNELFCGGHSGTMLIQIEKIRRLFLLLLLFIRARIANIET